MKGKKVCITGGGSGIGFQTAQELAHQGAVLILGVRNPEKGEQAAESIRQAVPGARVEVLQLDLASRRSIESFAYECRERFEQIDVLINNAGVMYSDFQTTEDGFEMQIGVNHFGHFLLTLLLLDLLKRSAEPRVITVASAAHYGAKIDFNRFRHNPGRYKGMPAYGQSKLANVLFARELARRHPAIRSYSLHPGVVSTRIVRQERGGWLLSLGWLLMRPFMLSPRRGAQTTLYLATSHPAPEPNGQYFDEHQKAMRPSSQALDEKLGRELWDKTLEMWREAGATI